MRRIKHYYNKLINWKIDRMWKVMIFLIISISYLLVAYYAVSSNDVGLRLLGMVMIFILLLPMFRGRNRDTQPNKAKQLRNAAAALVKANNEYAGYIKDRDWDNPEFFRAARRFDQKMAELLQAVKDYDDSV